MVQHPDKQPSIFRAIDWWTILIYMALLTFGWLSVCGASYTYGETDLFSLSARSGVGTFWHADCVDRHVVVSRNGTAFT